jgi:hypothetical protein
MPQMLGARDLPFPRLSAFGYWCYLFGGTLAFSSIFVGLAPDGGWFMYTPLTTQEYSPGINADVWLLGIGFIEISADHGRDRDHRRPAAHARAGHVAEPRAAVRLVRCSSPRR